MLVDELLEELKNIGIHFKDYADDIVLICRGKCEDCLLAPGEEAPRINPNKATKVPFTRKRRFDHLGATKLHCMEVNQETEVKYL